MAKKKVRDIDVTEKRAMLKGKDPHFSLRVQCSLLGLHRSGVYYRPRPVSEEDCRLMREVDQQYMKTPFYGRRRMTLSMRARGFQVGEMKIRATMKAMGLEAIYPKPRLSVSHPEHKKYPYLLRGLAICRPNLVWAADITYIPVRKGFGYLFAIMDWYSRYVVDWELSNLLDTEFCLEALERSLRVGKPEIFNTDQGVQFTSKRFARCLEEAQISISMDGRGRAFDNIMAERLWRSVKYEDVYPRAYESLSDVRIGLERYFAFYNEQRPHQGLNYRTPSEVYHGLL